MAKTAKKTGKPAAAKTAAAPKRTRTPKAAAAVVETAAAVETVETAAVAAAPASAPAPKRGRSAKQAAPAAKGGRAARSKAAAAAPETAQAEKTEKAAASGRGRPKKVQAAEAQGAPSPLEQIRRDNFEKLIAEAGGVAALARRCGYNKPAYLYQVRSRKKTANGQTLEVGARVAAKLEQGMNKPSGWMDSADHSAFAALPAPAKRQAAAPSEGGVQTVTLALTGASGMPYGIRLLEALLAAGKTVYLVYSQAAQIVAKQEMDLSLPASAEEAQKQLCRQFGVGEAQLRVFGRHEWFAPIASGSGVADAMVICPATMGTVASVAHGMAEDLLERAADVCLKEKRPLVIVPREAPFSSIHLENLLKLSNAGAVVLPPSPGFYHHPKTVADMVDFVVGRILDQLRIPHSLSAKWGG